MTGPSSIFISYARRDGMDIARALEQWLTEEGFDPWRDLSDEVIGDEWWRQIRDHIPRSRALVLAVTKASLESEMVRREIGVARREGVPVLPVTAVPEALKGAPRWIGRLDVFPLPADPANWTTEVMARLRQHLKDPPLRPPVLHNVPPRTPGTIQRTDTIAAIKKRMLEPDGDGRAGASIVLLGPGGYGKTTLIRDLCDDPEVIAAFSGGIAWATVGPGPGRTLRVCGEIVSQFTKATIEFSDLNTATYRLMEVLQDRDCLLVLDDVWDPAPIAALVGDRPWTLLVTTREPEVAAAALEPPIKLGLLEPADALELIVQKSALRDADAELLRAAVSRPSDEKHGSLLSEMGGWPLVLALAGAALGRQVSVHAMDPNEAVRWYQKGLSRYGPVFGDSRRSNERHLSLQRSIDISLELFPEADRERIMELSVLPRDLPIPVTAVGDLWAATAGADPFTSSSLLDEISGHFVQRTREGPNGELSIQLHPLMAEYLERTFGEKKYRAAHASLIDSKGPAAKPYVERFRSLWEVEHLTYHLVEAARIDECYELLTATPEWMEHSERRTVGIASFVNDLDRLAEALASDPGNLPRLAAVRAAQCVAHARNLRYQDEALRALVLMGGAEEALRYARQRDDAKSRFEGLTAVHDSLKADDPLRQIILRDLETTAAAIMDQRAGSGSLEKVAALHAANRDWEGIERVAELAPLEWARNNILERELMGLLEEGTFEHALSMVPRLTDPLSQARAYAELAARRAEPEACTALFRESFARIDGYPIDAAKHIGCCLGRSLHVDLLAALLDRMKSDTMRYAAFLGFARGRFEAGRRSEAKDLIDQLTEVICAEGFDHFRGTNEILEMKLEIASEEDVLRELERLPHPNITRRFFGAKAAAAGYWNLAERLAAEIPDTADRAALLFDMLNAYARAGERKCALETTARLLIDLDTGQPGRARDHWYMKIAVAIAPVDVEKALEVVPRITRRSNRATVMFAAARSCASEDRPRATSLLAAGLDLAYEPGEEWGGMLIALATLLGVCGRPVAAGSIADRVESQRQANRADPREKAFRGAAEGLAGAGMIGEARSLLERLDSPRARVSGEIDLFEARVAHGDLAGVMVDLANVEEIYRSYPLLSVLPEIVRQRSPDDAWRFWLEHRKSTSSDEWACMKIAVALAQQGEWTAALARSKPILKTMREQIEKGWQSSTPALFGLADFAIELQLAGKHDEAAEMADVLDRRLPKRQHEYPWLIAALAVTIGTGTIEKRLAEERDIVEVAEAWIYLGEKFVDLGRSAEARHALELAEPLAVRSARGESVLGIGRMQEGMLAPLLKLARAWVKAGDWSRAFQALGIQPPARFVGELMKWLSLAPDAPRLEVAREVLRIHAWLGKDWKQIEDIVLGTESDRP